MDQTNPLRRPDCPVTPLGIDAEGIELIYLIFHQSNQRGNYNGYPFISDSG